MPYLTVADPVQQEIVIERSRFIAHVHPAPDESTARNIIQQISKQHWNATHNCYAYMIGQSRHIQKASDDGEPSGTAGVPILEVIKKNGLTDIVIVVTRYFGGIKLGAGGLVRAYTRSANEGIQQAKLIRKEEHLFFRITIDYATWSRIETRLDQISIIHDKSFTEDVIITFSIPTHKQTIFTQSLDKWGSGQIRYEVIKTAFIATTD